MIQSDDPKLTAYALGELSPEESKSFQEELAKNPELLNEVKEIREVRMLLENELKDEESVSLTNGQKSRFKRVINEGEVLSLEKKHIGEELLGTTISFQSPSLQLQQIIWPLQIRTYDFPSLHHELNLLAVLQDLDVGQWVSIHNDKVGKLARLQGTQPVLHPHGISAVLGIGHDGLHWGHAVVNHELEL